MLGGAFWGPTRRPNAHGAGRALVARVAAARAGRRVSWSHLGDVSRSRIRMRGDSQGADVAGRKRCDGILLDKGTQWIPISIPKHSMYAIYAYIGVV